MSNIPEARNRLTQIAADLQDSGDYHTGQAILAIVDDCLWRVSPIRKAPKKSVPMTKARAKAIKKQAQRYPSKTQQEIADHIGVDKGRVSETLHGKYD